MPVTDALGYVSSYPPKYWLKCPERTRKDVSYDPSLMNEDEAAVIERMEAGNAYEDLIYDQLEESCIRNGWSYVRIDTSDMSDENLAKAEKLTKKALKAGVQVILGSRLVSKKLGLTGKPDLLWLENWDFAEKGEKPRYRPGDVKDHRAFEGTAKAPGPWLASTFDDLDPTHATAFLESRGHPQLVDVMQLSFYHLMLADAGYAGEKLGGLIGREGVVVWHDLEAAYYSSPNPQDPPKTKRTAMEVTKYAIEGYRKAVLHERNRMVNPTLLPLSQPEWKTECKECPWRSICHEELEEMDHISLLQGITPIRAKAHYAAGIKRRRDLANLDRRTALIVDAGVNVAAAMMTARLERLDGSESVLNVVTEKEYTVLRDLGVLTVEDLLSLDAITAGYSGTKVFRLAEAIDQARVFASNRVYRARGVEHVEIPRTAVELDIDIEDAPVTRGENRCYLIGVKETIRSRGSETTEYVSFMDDSDTDEGEARVFAEFWTYLQAKRQWASDRNVGAVTGYVYSGHEFRFFAFMAEKFKGLPGIPSVADVEVAFAATALGTSTKAFRVVDVDGEETVLKGDDAIEAVKAAKEGWKNLGEQGRARAAALLDQRLEKLATAKVAFEEGELTQEELAELEAAVMQSRIAARPEPSLESGYIVDMMPLVTKQLIWPTESNTVKALANLLRFFWRDETPGGANSVAWYREMIRSLDPETRAALERRLLEYNEDDVRATHRIRQWISDLGEARRPGVKLPSVESLDVKYGPKRRSENRSRLSSASAA